MQRIRLIIPIILATFALLALVVHQISAGSYNRSVAVSYANSWAHGRNGSYPNYGSGCGCNDCTNYISQVLHNGEYPLRTGNWDRNSIYEWWYRKVWWGYENSKTWSAADWLGRFAAQYVDFEFRTSPVYLEGGDFFLLDLNRDGKPDHGRVVVGYGFTSTNQADYTDGCGTNYPIPRRTYTLLINQHCVDRWHVAWDYRLPSGIRIWSIHVRW